jgi:DnaJ-domain-containing protein 1
MIHFQSTQVLFNSELILFRYHPNSVVEDGEVSWVAIIVAGSIVFGFFYYTYKILIGLIRNALGIGIFSKYHKATPENIREVYAILGCHLVYSEADNLGQQMIYLNNYLNRLFPNLQPYERNELPNLRRVYTDVEVVANWCELVLREEQKIQLLDFLIDLGFHNGTLNKRETTLVYFIGKTLGFPKNEIGALLNIRFLFHEKQKAGGNSQENNKVNRPSADHQKLKALKVLGLSSQTKVFEEVKKAYRTLARKHHPDRYHNATTEEQRMAHERFTEINWAHDFLKDRLH